MSHIILCIREVGIDYLHRLILPGDYEHDFVRIWSSILWFDSSTLIKDKKGSCTYVYKKNNKVSFFEFCVLFLFKILKQARLDLYIINNT